MKPLAALAIAFLGFGCSSAVTPSSPASSSPASTEPSITSSRSFLGSLRTRDREVLLYASPTGMKVTLKGSDGAVIADRVDLDALRALDPHIYEICRSGVANGAAYLDATLDTRVRSEPRDEASRTTPLWPR